MVDEHNKEEITTLVNEIAMSGEEKDVINPNFGKFDELQRLSSKKDDTTTVWTIQHCTDGIHLEDSIIYTSACIEGIFNSKDKKIRYRRMKQEDYKKE